MKTSNEKTILHYLLDRFSEKIDDVRQNVTSEEQLEIWESLENRILGIARFLKVVIERSKKIANLSEDELQIYQKMKKIKESVLGKN